MIAVIALGSNLGDKLNYLKNAIVAIEKLPKTKLLNKSSVYKSEPTGGVASEMFLNAVVEIETELSPTELLASLQAIENDNQRVREQHWGNRTLDLDLIDFDGIELNLENLQLPHPLAKERNFVLEPWLEINLEAELPKFGKVKDLLSKAEKFELEFYSEL